MKRKSMLASSVAASSDAKATVPVAAVMEQVMDTASNKANLYSHNDT